MTQSVTFHFSSPHYTFVSGSVAFTKGARLFSDGEFCVGRMTNGTVEDVLVEGPIEFDALLGDLTIVARADGRTHAVKFGRVTGQLREEDLRARQIPVIVDSAALIIVKVVNTEDRPLCGVIVSFMFPDWQATSEIATDARGEFAVLARPGRYCAKIGFVDGKRLPSIVKGELDISAADVGERVLLLRCGSG